MADYYQIILSEGARYSKEGKLKHRQVLVMPKRQDCLKNVKYTTL